MNKGKKKEDMLIYLQMIDSPQDKCKFTEVYETYRGLMFYVANQIVHNEHDAEDAVHQAFISIAQNIKKINDIKCPKTKHYIVTIVENKAIDLYRKKKRCPEVKLDECVMGISVEYQGEDRVAECILQLPARYREVIFLKFYQGYNNREIARILKLTEANVNKLVQRAKKQLRRCFMKIYSKIMWAVVCGILVAMSLVPIPLYAANLEGNLQGQYSQTDTILLEFIEKYVPEGAALKDTVIRGNQAELEPGARYSEVKGYYYAYTEDGVEKGIVIFDYESDEYIFDNDGMYIDVYNADIQGDLKAELMIYEEGAWKYSKDVQTYIGKISNSQNRIYVSGKEWGTKSDKSRLLLAVPVIEMDNSEIFFNTIFQKHHYNIIWIGDYPVKFYWKDAFKVIFFATIVVGIAVVLVGRVKKIKQLRSLMP